MSVAVPGANVARTITLSAAATDNVGVTRVEFLVDGSVVGTVSTTPYTFAWNTAPVADGSHSITARASDAAGNAATSAPVAITVQNTVRFEVRVSASEELPATPSRASGAASLDVNLATGAISGALVLTGMTATAAHIHTGFAGQNGPVLVGLVEDASAPGTWRVPANTSLAPTSVDELLDARLYLNAHSTAHPGGEIRGQIAPQGYEIGIAQLTGLQEVPALDSAGDAQGGVTVNRTTGRARIHLRARNLPNATAAHLHNGFGGRNGPVLIGLTQDGSDPSHWFAIDQPVTTETADAIRAGGTYLNVHTPANPNGEVRGQVTHAGLLFIVVPLDGAQEVPSNNSVGRGTAALTLARNTRAVIVNANAFGVDDATAAHVHDAYAGSNGGVIVPLVKDAGDVTRWSATAATFSEAQVDALLRGRLYVNVHTPAHPGGEIRGQFVTPDVRVVHTQMSGWEEVPAVTSPGTGRAATTVDLANRNVTIHVRTTALDDATASHIHRAARGSNGPVIVPLTQEAGAPGHWFAELAPVTAAQLADFAANLWYANVHTPAHPAGEIRGQIGLDPLPAPDSTAPSVGLGPLPGTVSGTVVLTATAQDDVGVSLVRFLLNGNVLGSDDTAPYSFSWDTTTAANGVVTITADARDAAGNVGLSGALVVTVDNPQAPPPDTTPPTVALGALPGTVSGTVTVTATAQDDVGVTLVRFLRNGNVLGSDDTAPYSYSWDTTAAANGPVTITADARDAAGNVGQSAATLVTVDNPQVPPPDTTPPTVALGALPGTVSGTVTLTATAQDDVGVTLVRFLVNGGAVGSDDTAPYSFNWETTTVANGQVTVSADARDAAGNVGTAVGQTTNISNPVASTLSQLQATIFTPRCSGCHTGGGAILPASMNLSSAAASYASLVNVPAEQQPAVPRVRPNDPPGSYLIRKLEGDPSISGARMPFGGPFLSATDMERVRSWINAGAPNN
ncbi:MAG: CHRD domain-containing protein [Steroidobacteraceae bacterium]|nr:CHRD domain-containing protein [Steroidobacteraceae bacterium]